MQAVHRVAKNTGILYAKMAITMFISLYSTRLVLAALGAEDFGLFNVVGGVIAMLGFLNASMAAASQRFMSFAQGQGDIDKVKKIFNVSTLMHLCIAFVIVIVFEIVGYFLFNGVLNIATSSLPTAKIIYQFMIVSTFFTVVSVPYEAVITSHENMLFYALEGIAEAIIKLSIAFFITFNKSDNLIMYGLLMALMSIFLLILRRVYCHWKYEECKIKLRHYYDKHLFKEMSSFAGWSLLGSSSSMIALYGQGIVINIFFGTIVNAAQGIVTQISGQLSVLANTLMVALNPMIAKSAGAGDKEMMLKATMMGSKISFFLLSILFIPFIIEMPFILGLWLKNVPEFTIIFCRLLLLRNLVEQLYIPVMTAINAIGKIKNFQKILGIMNMLPLLVSYGLFSFGFSPVYIYIVFIGYSIIKFGIVLHFAKINCDLSIPYFLKKVVLKCSIVFVLVGIVSFLVSLFSQDKSIELVMVLVFSFCSFVYFIWLFGLNNEERIIVINFKNKMLQRYKSVSVL